MMRDQGWRFEEKFRMNQDFEKTSQEYSAWQSATGDYLKQEVGSVAASRFFRPNSENLKPEKEEFMNQGMSNHLREKIRVLEEIAQKYKCGE